MPKAGPFFLAGFLLWLIGALLRSVPIALAGTVIAGAGFLVEYAHPDRTSSRPTADPRARRLLLGGIALQLLGVVVCLLLSVWAAIILWALALLAQLAAVRR